MELLKFLRFHVEMEFGIYNLASWKRKMKIVGEKPMNKQHVYCGWKY
jgi:hypothetical protein